MQSSIPAYSIQDFLLTPIPFPSFHINRLEEMPPLPEHIISPHQHRFVELFLVLEGQMEHNVDVDRYAIKADSLFFIAQGQFHFWCRTLTPLKGYRLMFEERFIEGLILHRHLIFELVHLNRLYHQPLLPIPPAILPRLTTCFGLLHEEYRRQDPSPQVLMANLYMLLMEILRLAGCHEATEGSHYHLQHYQQLITLIEQQLSANPSIEWYAEQLHLTVAQLNRIVRKFSATTTSKLIQARKILEAKRMLATTKQPIQEVAAALGFDDTSYFARLFKKHEGCTPQEFRMNL